MKGNKVMKNLKKTQQTSQKISNSEEFFKAMEQEAKKRGLSEYLDKTPLQPTNKYTVTFRPFAQKRKEKNDD